MSREVPTLMGSGTLPYTYQILHTTLGGTATDTLTTNACQGKGIRTGTQVAISNPEDIVAAPAIRASGITVGTTAINVVNQIMHDAILKRGRMIMIENLGPGHIYIGGTPNVSASIFGGEPGFQIDIPTNAVVPKQFLELPLLNGAEIWAVSDAANTEIRFLFY